LSSLSNLFPKIASLRAPKRWKSGEARSGLDGGWRITVRVSSVVASYGFRCVCACVVMLKEVSTTVW